MMAQRPIGLVDVDLVAWRPLTSASDRLPNTGGAPVDGVLRGLHLNGRILQPTMRLSRTTALGDELTTTPIVVYCMIDEGQAARTRPMPLPDS